MSIPEIPCPQCGKNVSMTMLASLLAPQDKWFCSNCGLQLVSKCNECGTKLYVGERFCRSCGKENPIYFKKR